MEYNQAIDKKTFARDIALAIGYGLFLFTVESFLAHAGIGSESAPTDITLNRWDAGIYLDIAKHGYSYPDPRANNTGCYILFPWVWRLLHVGVLGISIANLVFFSIGFAIVAQLYPMKDTEKFLWLTTPSLYFMLVPYTEALFCLTIAIAFLGIARKNRWLIWAGLFLASLTRATAVFMIPSLLIMELLTGERKDFKMSFGRYLVNYAFPTVAGLVFFVLLQYYDTGVWFAYFKQQTTYLEHRWAWPTLPFSNFYGGNRIFWLSSLAAAACVFALVMILIKCAQWLFRNRTFPDRLNILTLSYMPFILFTMVFCNPLWGTGTTNLLGLHRYAFCSPFIFILLHQYGSGSRKYTIWHYVGIVLLCNLVWLTMGSYQYSWFFWFLNFNTLIFLAYMLQSATRVNWAYLMLAGTNMFMQITLFQQYLGGHFTD